MRQAFTALGWHVADFVPAVSWLGDWQARLQQVAPPDLVWVPCFRHRDAAAAVRFARSRSVPVVFDPLISAYDKAVFEKERCAEGSRRAEQLRAWESSLMSRFDAVVADTGCHAEFYAACFNLPPSRLHVIPVGAEPGIFIPQPAVVRSDNERLRVLFYGSFIGLQGPEIISEAARLVPEADWTLLGDGPLKERCESVCSGLPNVQFVSWVPYEELPSRIGAADILLGVFGASAKAGRVIPNKVYQALACGRPVITQRSAAYPRDLEDAGITATGLRFIEPGSSPGLAAAVRELLSRRSELPQMSLAASSTFLRCFSNAAVEDSLKSLIESLVASAGCRS